MRNLAIVAVFGMFTACQADDKPAVAPEADATTHRDEPHEPHEPHEIDELNAVDVDSDTHKVELENDRVRVIRYRAPAGYTSNQHTHLGGAYVSLSDSQSITTLENGETVAGESKFGDAGAFFEFAGVKHVTANVGESDVEEVMVEVKRQEGAPIAPPTEDAVLVDPDHHTVEFENDVIRLLRMRYPEGYVTPPHNHYSGVNILLTDVHVSSGPEGEDVAPTESEAGVASWADGGEPHVTRNLGGPMELIRVELKVQ